MDEQPQGRARRGAPGSKPSIYDVAVLAGVSHQTVSRVINGRPNIKASTREKVEAAMSEIGYIPSSIARALATNRSRRIGVIVDSPMEFGPGSTMRGIEQAAVAAGYSVAAATVDDGMEAAYDHLKLQGVEALCVIAPRYSMIPMLREFGRDLPTILLKAEPEDDLLTAAVDQYAGAVHAVDHLLELGHRRILHLAGPTDWADARVRGRAFSDRLGAEGLPLLPELSGDWSSDSGYEIGRTAPEFDDVTAVFVGNDQMALGLIHGLRTRGIRVPEDISVVGFDDLPDARHFLPPLTTVRQDFAELGRVAIRTLLARLEGDPDVASTMLEPELIVRESTAPAR
ncbi:MAG: transcriptional regulator [Microbacterium sp. SCN 70-200]|uniref:LacI family DNA-binding transcriptional regulator n=1 Tax=unclassified Microbacterium TaxID=2609290 RepID=UPI0008695113|nr:MULTISPECIES: LacI family DNA-binding transcriptional regulator [unclassified Microbacterium]MBN9215389.1 LacI family DNA-binding transcriptional regulator [Microbacterium sp.]ODT41165.1 MAG: transcriptional regulator [Microbacterium sp. SCN 70-200]OJV79439.1 MAG: transcriptional regulator [Microbacterium sp. 70-16]